jgi:hypothetical protein
VRCALQKLSVPVATTFLQRAFIVAIQALPTAPERQAVYMLRIVRATLVHGLALLANHDDAQFADFFSSAIVEVHKMQGDTTSMAHTQKSGCESKPAVAAVSGVKLTETPFDAKNGEDRSRSSSNSCCPGKSGASVVTHLDASMVSKTGDRSRHVCSATALPTQSGELARKDQRGATVSEVQAASDCDKTLTSHPMDEEARSLGYVDGETCTEQNALHVKDSDLKAQGCKGMAGGLSKEVEQFVVLFSASVEAALEWYAGVRLGIRWVMPIIVNQSVAL